MEHKAKIEAVLSAFKLAHDSDLHLYGSNNDRAETERLIGSMTLEKWNAERRIEQLLKEIDM